MPYAYLANPSLVIDAWAIRKLANDMFNQDGWSYEDNVNYGETTAAAGENETDNTAGTGMLRGNAPNLLKLGEIIEVEEPEDSAGLFHICC